MCYDKMIQKNQNETEQKKQKKETSSLEQNGFN